MGVKPEEAQIEAARAVIANGYSVRRTEQLAAQLMREPKAEKPDDGKIHVDYAAEVTKRLEKALGRRVKLSENGRRGRITLEYYGADDRERLISALENLK